MTSLLDEFTFPWHKRIAQELHLTLTQLHPTMQRALAIASEAGLDVTTFAEQSPKLMWHAILSEAAVQGQLRALVQRAHDLLSPSSPKRPFLASLLNNELPPTDVAPATIHFLHATDTVSAKEALLYYDDLTIETSNLPALIATLTTLLALAPAVCRLLVVADGESFYGTGFRIGSDLLLTNWHVLHHPQTQQQATTVMAEFSYENSPNGESATAIPCDVNSIRGIEIDDWAIIRPSKPLAPHWPIIPLSATAKLSLQTTTYIIQHPGGGFKRLGYVRNLVSYFDDQVVQYLTDTQAGSSGAPVFNSDGELIALHHVGGEPQEKVGMPPLKKNEGILIACVLEGFAELGITLPV